MRSIFGANRASVEHNETSLWDIQPFCGDDGGMCSERSSN